MTCTVCPMLAVVGKWGEVVSGVNLLPSSVPSTSTSDCLSAGNLGSPR